jgi:hypothetical protein
MQHGVLTSVYPSLYLGSTRHAHMARPNGVANFCLHGELPMVAHDEQHRQRMIVGADGELAPPTHVLFLSTESVEVVNLQGMMLGRDFDHGSQSAQLACIVLSA